MKLSEKIEEIAKTGNEKIDEYMSLNVVGSMVNFLGDAIHEIEDEEIRKAYDELVNLIQEKRKVLWESEL